ncbi:alpha/beta hydrolase [Archangium violaceum]|nr:alpha/beta hydrolase [Archangium violaceum]
MQCLSKYRDTAPGTTEPLQEDENVKHEQRLRLSPRRALALTCLVLLGACGHSPRRDSQPPASCQPWHSVRANGIDIEYETFGKEGNPPLLLIMGVSVQMVFWDEEFIEQLVQRGFRVIRFDNRDVGRSTHFRSAGVPSEALSSQGATSGRQPDVPYLLSDMAADAAGLLDALGLKAAHVVGLSMGGMIAQELAIRHPERVLSLTSLMSTTSDPSLPGPKPELLPLFRQEPARDREQAIEQSMRLFRAIASPGFPLDEAGLRKKLTLSYDRCYDPEGTIRQQAAIMASGSRKQALASVKAPSLVIHGKEDPVIPVEAGIDTARSIPGAELLVVEGLGHDLPREVWPQIVEAIAANAARAPASTSIRSE